MPTLRPTALRSVTRPLIQSAHGWTRPVPRSTQLWRRSYAAGSTVRIHKAPMTFRRAATIGFYIYITYHITQFAIQKFAEYVGLDEEKLKALDKEAEEELEDDEAADLLFIPLQFPRELPRQFYKTSDPEWQEFVKLGKDTERKKEVSQELANMVVGTVSKHPALAKNLGKDIKLQRFWLDYVFPDGPAPDYARYGIAFLDEGIALSEQTIPHSEYVQLRHIIYPKAVFTALAESLYFYYTIKKVRLKTYLGLRLDQQERASLGMLQFIERNAAGSRQDHAAERDATPGEVSGNERLAPPTDPGTLPSGGASSGEVQEGKGFRLPIPVVPVMIPAHVFMSTMHFRARLSQLWPKSKRDAHPPGAVFMTGTVETAGSRGRVTLEVLAAYNPKDKKFDYVDLRLKMFWLRSQQAKGGP